MSQAFYEGTACWWYLPTHFFASRDI